MQRPKQSDADVLLGTWTCIREPPPDEALAKLLSFPVYPAIHVFCYPRVKGWIGHVARAISGLPYRVTQEGTRATFHALVNV